MSSPLEGFAANLLPSGVRSSFAEGVNGLRIHYLDAGFEKPGRPCVLLLHGFPDLACSWRKVMPAIAAAGYHVVAPDMRGYGRTTGWAQGYDIDLREFSILNIVSDVVGLLSALGYTSAAAVVGHDYGSSAAGWCALVRPDLFRKVVMMSAPFEGAPVARADSVEDISLSEINRQLGKLLPPRKHYQCYYATRAANQNMIGRPEGLHNFFRAYYHVKSADEITNQPYRLASWSAAELAKLPRYYVMDSETGMAETVAGSLPDPETVANCTWMPDDELAIYVEEYRRTGFQGALNWYRCDVDGTDRNLLEAFGGKTIDIPSMFISGASDWGTYQRPHHAEKMQQEICTDFRGFHLVDGAGHWVQQEQPEQVSRLILDFLRN